MWHNLTLADWHGLELAKRMNEAALRTYNAGGAIRAMKGKSVDEWESKSAREHLAHATAHLSAALGCERPDIQSAVDMETYLAHTFHALLRVAMANHVSAASKELVEVIEE